MVFWHVDMVVNLFGGFPVILVYFDELMPYVVLAEKVQVFVRRSKLAQLNLLILLLKLALDRLTFSR